MSFIFITEGTTSYTFFTTNEQRCTRHHITCSSLVLVCHAMPSPPSPRQKKRLLTTEPHPFPFVFVVCLHSVEQTNHIIAKCEWRKISHGKASGFCFTPHARHQNWAVFAGYDHDATEEETCEWKPQVQRLHVLITVCSAHERIYMIFWKYLIVSVNLKASYGLKTGAAFRTRCQQIERSYLTSQSLY